VILGIVISVIAGCSKRDIPTIWRSEVASPDGKWIAIAHTEQDGGFGSAWIGTRVDLRRVDGTVDSGKPVNILAFDCFGPAKHAYTLDPANAGGTIDLTLHWSDPTHLEATYNGRADLNFEVAKLAGIVISVTDLSTELNKKTVSK
jgi:hypothetical protein